MRRLYQRWMYDWETRLTTRDTNRVVRPFEWGVEWTREWPCVNGNLAATAENAEQFMHALNREILAHSGSFFAYRTPADFRLERRLAELHSTGSEKPAGSAKKVEADFLRFTSPVNTPYPENNLASARWFPARGRRAVVVLPQWNADAESHNGLCRIFNLVGVAALRLSLPYHDVRKPPELERADYAVSANVGRTIDAARQAILEIRCGLDWLQSQGYTRLGVVGTSLGSCYAFIASAHDERLQVNVFNHASTYFGDVVWSGQSTRHVRAGLDQANITQDSVRRAWLAISPISYFDQFAKNPKKSLIIYGSYDLTFPPELSREIAAEFRRRHLDLSLVALPCGHYSIGEAPFKYLDGYYMASFLRTAF